MRVVSLFCGVGGFELAAAPWSPEIVLANDKDPEAIETYRDNFPDARIVHGAVEDLDFATMAKEEKEKGDIDLLTAGFPCQSFSILGKRLGVNDAQGEALFSIFDAVSHLRPRCLVLENVRGLAWHANGDVLRMVLDRLRTLGYDVDWRVLHAHLHGGVPQNRERIFIVGRRRQNGEKNENDWFPWPETLAMHETQSLEDVLHSDPPPKYDIKRTSTRLNDDIWATVNRPGCFWTRARFLYRKVEEGKATSVLQPFTIPGLAPTLLAGMKLARANMAMLLGPRGPRVLSPRECARLQGFPDDYRLHPTERHAYAQMGNTVCVALVRRVLASLLFPDLTFSFSKPIVNATREKPKRRHSPASLSSDVDNKKRRRVVSSTTRC